MVKSYTLQNLGCPNCAAKMETAIGALSGVKAASVSYQNKLLRLEGEDVDALLPEMQNIVSGIESDVRIVPRVRGGKATPTFQGQGGECCGGHDHVNHDHGEGCVQDHGEGHGQAHGKPQAASHDHGHGEGDTKKRTVLLGGALYVAAMVGHWLWESAMPPWAWLLVFVVPYLILAGDVFKEAAGNIRRCTG